MWKLFLCLLEWLLCSSWFLRDVDEFLSTPGRWIGQHWYLPQCQDCLYLSKSLHKGPSQSQTATLNPSLCPWQPCHVLTPCTGLTVTQSLLRQTECVGPCPVFIYIYYFFWHWSFRFCCKFLIDDSSQAPLSRSSEAHGHTLTLFTSSVNVLATPKHILCPEDLSVFQRSLWQWGPLTVFKKKCFFCPF